MADDNPKPIPEASASSAVADRVDLIEKARAFLLSPQIRTQDDAAKRSFLVQKGLNEGEVERLMAQMPPLIPPRTYPQPPPSNLLGFLVAFSRIVAWLTGGSAIILLFYYKYLLPRLTLSLNARHMLKSNQLALVGKLQESLMELKKTRQTCFADLVPPPAEKQGDDNGKASIEPSNNADEASNSTPSLSPSSPVILPGLSRLRASIPPPRKALYPGTLQAFADLTAYVSSQTYMLPLSASFGITAGEEVKREIRALKGLVLNRRSFALLPPRPPSISH